MRAGWVDFVGIGRMVLSYPEMPLDSLRRGRVGHQTNLPHLQRLHRPAPRKGLISGCFPLDEVYKQSDAGRRLRESKTAE